MLEIKADEKSKAEFERHLFSLNTRKEELNNRLRENKEWLVSYDRDIGPFTQKYNIFQYKHSFFHRFVHTS